MNMTAKELPNGDLEIRVSADLQDDMRTYRDENPQDFGTDMVLWDYLEALTGNSDYQLCRPEYVDALTDAPMLATYGETEPLPPDAEPRFVNYAGQWDGQQWYSPVLKCWAYTSYAYHSPLDDLADTGTCIWHAGQEQTEGSTA